MPHIVILATGGTISSQWDARGAATAVDNASTLLSTVATPSGVTVEPIDVLRENSFNFTPHDLRTISEVVRRQLGREDVDGIVITHGTDTVEETAILLELTHDDRRPVVITGAQKPSAAPDSDGPQNLRDAIHVASAPASRDRGVMIVFGGEVLAAYGTRKAHTLIPQPFMNTSGPIGFVTGGSLRYHAYPERRIPLAPLTEAFDTTKVDATLVFPGASVSQLSSESAGLVLVGTGTGNLNREYVNAVRSLNEQGTVVALSTRVPHGPVAVLYGNGGGGVDAVEAGAIPVTTLPFTQTAVLLRLLLSSQTVVQTKTLLAQY